MILSCPNCGTRYSLSESQLGPNGRKVRCSACKTTWHAEAPPAEPIELAPEAPAKPRVEDLQKVKAERLPSRYRALLQDKKRLKALTAQGLVWGGLAGGFVAVLAFAFILRVDIVRAFPRIAGAYAMVGVKVNATHLEFGTKSADASFKGGRFYVTVKAQIRNISDKAVPVPPVRVKLMDASLQTFSTALIPSGGLSVPPHQTRTLTFDVADPKNLTSSIDMDFDLEALKTGGQRAPLRHADSHDDDAPQTADEAALAAAIEAPVETVSGTPSPYDAHTEAPDAAMDAPMNAPVTAHVTDHATPALRTTLADAGGAH
ncbi:MAG TPA: MJ0042-type zinc finger domain-containing protein [Asticcacaulis sp.]|nr:MJ0042-type zinc finger domain-containing protein [Asticcacaulis sp.]